VFYVAEALICEHLKLIFHFFKYALASTKIEKIAPKSTGKHLRLKRQMQQIDCAKFNRIQASLSCTLWKEICGCSTALQSHWHSYISNQNILILLIILFNRANIYCIERVKSNVYHKHGRFSGRMLAWRSGFDSEPAHIFFFLFIP
jgi:hypothetical protein